MRPPLSLGVGPILAGLLALPIGCAETPPPVAPVATAAPIATPPPPVVDLSPVPEPADIVLVARWKNPQTTLTNLSACSGIPQQLTEGEVHRLLDRVLGKAFRGGVDGKQIAEEVALDAPLDLVMSLESGRRGGPGALFAFSVALSSLDRAKSTLEAAGPLVELEPGFWRVGVKDGGDLTCVIGASAGSAPARLICGPHDKDVSTLGPYLARNLPVAPPPAQDIHAELRFAPAEARYGADARRLLSALPGLARIQAIGEPHFDRALDEAANGLAAEATALLTDLDQASVDVTVDSSACLTTSASLQLRGKSSWIGATLAERSEKVGPPPPIFWRAPVDSASASYGRAADDGRAVGILRALRGLVEGKLAKEQVGSDADRKALVKLLAMPIAKDTAYVVASGQGTPAKIAATGAKPTEEQIVESLASSYVGWYLLGFEEGPAGLSKLLKDFVSVYGRKGLLDPLRKAMGRDGDSLPTIKLVPAPAQLGRGALDVEIHFDLPRKAHADDAKPKKGAGLTFHALLMGEPERTWIAIGTNREELVKRLLGTKAGAPDAGTLASRPGLEPIRSGKALSSGFVTLGMFTHGVASILSSPLLPSSSSPMLADVTNTLNNVPHKGDTPIFVVSNASAAGPRTDVAVNMQRGSFEDIGAILLTIHRIATNAGLRP